MVRTGFSGIADPVKLADFTARYGTNSMTCVFFDFIILTLVRIFLAGCRHLIRQADARQQWLGTVVFGVGLVYVTLTLVADLLQAGTVVDARTHPRRRHRHSRHDGEHASDVRFRRPFPDGRVHGRGWVRGRGQPRSACVERLGRLSLRPGLLAFVSPMFVGSPDFKRFYNAVGWGAIIAECLPLTVGIIVVGI